MDFGFNKTVYLIDSENLNAAWVEVIAEMKSRDQVVVFYTKNSSYMSLDKVRFLSGFEGRVTWTECFTGTNALDFQLVSTLGYMIAKRPKDHYVILANDTGYDAVVKYWEEKGISIQRDGVVTGIPKKQSKRRNRKKLALKKKALTTVKVEETKPAEEVKKVEEPKKVQEPKKAQESKKTQTDVQANVPSVKSAGKSKTEFKEFVDKAEQLNKKKQEKPEAKKAKKSEKKLAKKAEEIKQKEKATEKIVEKPVEAKAEKKEEKPTAKAAEKKPETKKVKDPVKKKLASTPKKKRRDYVEDLGQAIHVDKAEDFHLALVCLFGQDSANAIYNNLKKDKDWRSQIATKYLAVREQKVDAYIRTILEFNRLPMGDSDRIANIILTSDIQKLNQIYDKFLSTFGNEQGRQYYSAFKSSFKLIQKM